MECRRSIVDENDIATFHFLGSGSPYCLLEFKVKRYSILVLGLNRGPQDATTMSAQNHSINFQFVEVPANRKRGHSKLFGKFINRKL